MKNKASGFLKRVVSLLTSMARAKSMSLKHKANALRTRFLIFSLLRNKKTLMTSISRKFQALMHHQHSNEDDQDQDKEEFNDQSKGIVVYNHNDMNTLESLPSDMISEELQNIIRYDEERSKYPDLTHSLFEEEGDNIEDTGGSVIELVKNSKKDQGQEFRLEDEIDHVADLFIKKFHRQIMIQKQQSLKRYQEMLERSV